MPCFRMRLWRTSKTEDAPAGTLQKDLLEVRYVFDGSVYTVQILVFLPRLPNVPLLRALWSLLDGIWGVLKGSWGCWYFCLYSISEMPGHPPSLAGQLAAVQRVRGPLPQAELANGCHFNSVYLDPKSM